MKLLNDLQLLLPPAIDWARQHEAIIQEKGIPLTEEQLELARQVGVKQPEKVKLLEVETIPFPDHEELNTAAKQVGFLNEDMKGLTLGYSIYLCRGYYSKRLISHELRHVYHYEVFGSIPEFLVEYLKQIVLVGYSNAPLEQDAKNHELDD